MNGNQLAELPVCAWLNHKRPSMEAMEAKHSGIAADPAAPLAGAPSKHQVQEPAIGIARVSQNDGSTKLGAKHVTAARRRVGSNSGPSLNLHPDTISSRTDGDGADDNEEEDSGTDSGDGDDERAHAVAVVDVGTVGAAQYAGFGSAPAVNDVQGGRSSSGDVAVDVEMDADDGGEGVLEEQHALTPPRVMLSAGDGDGISRGSHGKRTAESSGRRDRRRARKRARWAIPDNADELGWTSDDYLRTPSPTSSLSYSDDSLGSSDYEFVPDEAELAAAAAAAAADTLRIRAALEGGGSRRMQLEPEQPDSLAVSPGAGGAKRGASDDPPRRMSSPHAGGMGAGADVVHVLQGLHGAGPPIPPLPRAETAAAAQALRKYHIAGMEVRALALWRAVSSVRWRLVAVWKAACIVAVDCHRDQRLETAAYKQVMKISMLCPFSADT
jgi:hypothetical protein